MPVTDTSVRDQILQQMVAKHGVWTSNPIIDEKATPTSHTVNGVPIPDQVDDPAYIYRFGDGSTVSVNGAGQVFSQDEKSPTAGDQSHPNVTDSAGNVYIWNKDTQQYGLAPGLPQGSKPTEGQTRQAVDNGRNVTQTFQGGQWVTTSIGTNAVPGAPQEGDTRQAIDSGRNVTQTYRGGQWVTTSVGGSAIPGAPQEGDTRQAVDSGRNVTQTYRGGQWVTTSVGGSAIPGAPQQGQTRQTVDSSGRTVTQTYDGSNWVNTAIAGAPKEGDTRQTIQSGRYVTETYSGGQWVPTSIGANATPGAANKGDTRQIVEGGYNVTQTYDGNSWNTTSVGTKATPTPPSVISAPSTEPLITTMSSTGQIATQPNASYQAKTLTDVAGQVARLQSAAQAQRDQISSQLQTGAFGTGPDAQQKAAAAFDSWWAQNVEPQKASLAVAQQQAQQAQQQAIAEQNRANLATAQNAAQTITTATANDQRPTPAYLSALGSVLNATAARQKAPSIDLASIATQAPDYSKIYEQATAQALAHISPTAAQIATGQPVPTALNQIQGADITGQLNRTNYDAFGNPAPAQAAPAPAAAGAPMPPAPMPPAPTPPIQGTPLNFGNTLAQGTGPYIPPAWQQPAPNFGNPQLAYAPGPYVPGPYPGPGFQ